MEVIFYTTHCPRCIVLEKKLQQNGISYTESSDVDQMIALGFKSAPLLQIDGARPMDFGEAIKWIREFSVNADKH